MDVSDVHRAVRPDRPFAELTRQNFSDDFACFRPPALSPDLLSENAILQQTP